MYLLDTNICIYLMKNKFDFLAKRVEQEGLFNIALAAQCLSRDFCLVINNVKDFERVPMLKIENWVSKS